MGRKWRCRRALDDGGDSGLRPQEPKEGPGSACKQAVEATPRKQDEMQARGIEPERASSAQVAASLLGLENPTKDVLAPLENVDLSHECVVGKERERYLLEALQRSESPELTRSGPERHEAWEQGWRENLTRYKDGGCDTRDLIPRYNHYRVLRWSGEYVRVQDSGFEYAVYGALRAHYFTKYFAGLESVTEFGCGTGTSLLHLAELQPKLRLRGCDWAPSSQELLKHLAQVNSIRLEGRHFDMFAPDSSLMLEPGSGVFTSAALEQIGTRHEPFVDYLLAQDSSVHLHIEPLVELYGEHGLFDEVAIRYHKRRAYLEGFVPRLLELETRGLIEVLELRRTGFGSFFHEGYSVVAWRKR
jgi:hypothetical protein